MAWTYLMERRMDDLPDTGLCAHCSRPIVWDDWSYTHMDGWANCRDPQQPDKLGTQHCALLYECAECSQPDCNWRGTCEGESCPACGGHVVPVPCGVEGMDRG